MPARGSTPRRNRGFRLARVYIRVRPFHGGGQNELVKQPKVYAFASSALRLFRSCYP